MAFYQSCWQLKVEAVKEPLVKSSHQGLNPSFEVPTHVLYPFSHTGSHVKSRFIFYIYLWYLCAKNRLSFWSNDKMFHASTDSQTCSKAKQMMKHILILTGEYLKWHHAEPMNLVQNFFKQLGINKPPFASSVYRPIVKQHFKKSC